MSLVHVLFRGLSASYVVVGRVVQAVVIARVVLRHYAYVICDSVVGLFPINLFMDPRRWLRVRRVVCGGETLPFVFVVVP